MQQTNQNDSQTNIELRLRTLLILWIAMLMSFVGLYVLTIVTRRPHDVTPNPVLSLVLLCIGLLITVLSFPVKNRLLSKAVAQQQIEKVQQAYIVAWALTDVAALLGILDFFLANHAHYYILLIIAVIGTLLHFPRRETVENAAFKRTI